MEYAKLQLVDTRTLTWRTASMHARGAAVTILAHCADQENDGRIIGCKGWDPATWSAVVGVRPIDLARVVDAGLCFWEGDDLCCPLYDRHGQRALETKREQGPHGAKGGRPKKTHDENPSDNPKGFQKPNPSDNPQSSPPIPDQSSPPIPPTAHAEASDADRWPYERVLPWVKALTGCKIGPQNWPTWKGLVDAHGVERVAQVAKTIGAKVRWPDAVEEALAASRGQEPIAAAVAPKIQRLTL